MPSPEDNTASPPNQPPRDFPFGGGTGSDGYYDIRIGRDGTWYYRDSPIRRKPLVRLFASVLRRHGDEYWLVTPAERGRITVEDAPFTAIAVEPSGAGSDRILRFTTNIGETVTADSDHPIRVTEDAETGEPRPYISIRDGLDALILRPVFYELVDLAEEKPTSGHRDLGVWSGGCFFILGRVEPDDTDAPSDSET